MSESLKAGHENKSGSCRATSRRCSTLHGFGQITDAIDHVLSLQFKTILNQPYWTHHGGLASRPAVAREERTA